MLSRLARLCVRTRAVGIRTASSFLSQPLKTADPAMADILNQERARQSNTVTLILLENFTLAAVLTLLGLVFQNKYSEGGIVGERFYGGTMIIDEAERICMERAVHLFRLDQNMWLVNVQPLSGAVAHTQVYSALLQPGDTVLGLDLPTDPALGGFIAKFFNAELFLAENDTGLVNYDELADVVLKFRPKLISTNTMNSTRPLDYARLREIADLVHAVLLCDISHVAGLVATGYTALPFNYADLVITTTHKLLRGPRGAMIYFRNNVPEFRGVFASHQGLPQNHTIAALAVALGQANLPEFAAYQRAVLSNAEAFAVALANRNFVLVGGGTETHLVVVDLHLTEQLRLLHARTLIDGARMEYLLDRMNILTNKTALPLDPEGMPARGLKLGVPAMTTRSFSASEFEHLADLMVKALAAAERIENALEDRIDHPNQEGGRTMRGGPTDDSARLEVFKRLVDVDGELDKLAEEVTLWVSKFPTPE